MVKFDWVELITGLFHLQMNVLKMLLHVLGGEPAGEGIGVRRFATMLRRQGVVTMDMKDFHACNDGGLCGSDVYPYHRNSSGPVQ